jgi:hypothetical protein
MSYFPIKKIPQQIEQVRSAQPPVPVFTESLPQRPGSEPQKLNATVIAVETAVAVPTVAIVSQGKTIPGLLLLLVAVGAIAGHAWHQITTYPQRKQKHDREVVTYPKKVEIYEKKKREHEEEVKATQSPQGAAEFRYKLLLETLSKTVPHDGDRSTATKGAAEDKFGSHLRRYFPSKIYQGLTIKIPDFEYPYTTDITYIDSSLKLYIDIEIDEPYVYHTGEPTHFVGAWKDNRRNSFFISRGWVVVRFSEEQAVCYPHSCCKTVAQVIAQITGDTSILNQFANIPDLQQQRQWTEQEAVEMAANSKRDDYPC